LTLPPGERAFSNERSSTPDLFRPEASETSETSWVRGCGRKGDLRAYFFFIWVWASIGLRNLQVSSDGLGSSGAPTVAMSLFLEGYSDTPGNIPDGTRLIFQGRVNLNLFWLYGESIADASLGLN
jgi:hypothetical protein